MTEVKKPRGDIVIEATWPAEDYMYCSHRIRLRLATDRIISYPTPYKVQNQISIQPHAVELALQQPN
jgi:hypothetical protein